MGYVIVCCGVDYVKVGCIDVRSMIFVRVGDEIGVNDLYWLRVE